MDIKKRKAGGKKHMNYEQLIEELREEMLQLVTRNVMHCSRCTGVGSCGQT